MNDYEPRPDTSTADDLRSGVEALAAAVTEPGISRVERVNRSRYAAEAMRNVSAAAHLLNPYRDRRHHELLDRVLVASNRNAPLDGQPGTAALAAARDRLACIAVTRAAGPLTSGQVGDMAALQLRPATSTLEPWAGGVVALDAGPLDRAVTPWLIGYATIGERPFRGVETQPTRYDDLPQATINPDLKAADLTAANPTIDGTPAVWDLAALYVTPDRQLLDWTEGATVYTDAAREAVLRGLETAVITRLTTGAPTAGTFAAAEALAGAAWPGSGADLVLCSAEDLPYIRRAYATDLPDPTLRPRILATAGVPAGTALVMCSAAVNLRRTALEVLTGPRPSAFALDAVVTMSASATLRAAGAVVAVDVTALTPGVTP